MTRDHETIPLLPPRRPDYAPARTRLDGAPTERYSGILSAVPGEWALVESLHRIRDHADRRSNPTGGKDSIPANAGGQTLTAVVSAAVGTAGDTRVPHRLGRVPEAIVHVEETSPPGGTLNGRPEGGDGATGGNHNVWTTTEVYLRSNVPAPGRAFVFTLT